MYHSVFMHETLFLSFDWLRTCSALRASSGCLEIEAMYACMLSTLRCAMLMLGR